MAQDTVPAPLGPSFPSQWLQSRAGFQVLAALPCWAGPTHGPAFPESCLMPWAGLGMLLLPSCWLGWNMCWLCPDGSPGELSPPPLSYSMGPTSLCGAWIMAMFIKIILIKKRKKNPSRLFLNWNISQKTFSSKPKLTFTRLLSSVAICIKFNSTKRVVSQAPHSESSKYCYIIARL